MVADQQPYTGRPKFTTTSGAKSLDDTHSTDTPATLRIAEDTPRHISHGPASGTSMAFRASEAEHRTASGYPVDLHGHVLSLRPPVPSESEAIGHDSLVATGID
jgi:hypothetical protein